MRYLRGTARRLQDQIHGNLIGAEWLKLSHRPMAWVLLVIFLFFLVLSLSVPFLVLALHDGVFTGGETRVEFPVITAAQIEQFRRQISFPGLFGEILGQVNGVGGVLAVILAAGAMGGEYDWGTLRVQLARSPDRGSYLLAKVLTLLLILLAGIAIALVVGSLFGLFCGLVLGNVGRIGVADVVLLPIGMMRALFIMLPYLLFAIATGVLGRSTMAGIAGGILLIVVDAGAGAPALLATVDNPMVSLLYNLLIQQNVNALVVVNRGTYGLDPMVMTNLDPAHLPHPLQATVVLAGYSLLFLGYAWVLLTRRDVPGGVS
ncbi:MAG: ABC transporter permease subunit [Chloroflexaceae bacterium]|nr:ABC transporter permease subunit [Chloroflexaceae bacterium]